MGCKTEISDHFIHAGGGTALVLGYLGLIPGFLPIVALTVLVTGVVVLPFLTAGLAMALIAAPPYAIWRLINGVHRRRVPEPTATGVRPRPFPSPHTS
jgi:hypothetical protein